MNAYGKTLRFGLFSMVIAACIAMGYFMFAMVQEMRTMTAAVVAMSTNVEKMSKDMAKMNRSMTQMVGMVNRLPTPNTMMPFR